jgi:hypothetical protein
MSKLICLVCVVLLGLVGCSQVQEFATAGLALESRVWLLGDRRGGPRPGPGGQPGAVTGRAGLGGTQGKHVTPQPVPAATARRPRPIRLAGR